MAMDNANLVHFLKSLAALGAIDSSVSVSSKELGSDLGISQQSASNWVLYLLNEGYITAGMYDDGYPGEIFVVMAKEGSTISGLMDSWATSISMALHHLPHRRESSRGRDTR